MFKEIQFEDILFEDIQFEDIQLVDFWGENKNKEILLGSRQRGAGGHPSGPGNKLQIFFPASQLGTLGQAPLAKVATEAMVNRAAKKFIVRLVNKNNMFMFVVMS